MYHTHECWLCVFSQTGASGLVVKFNVAIVGPRLDSRLAHFFRFTSLCLAYRCTPLYLGLKPANHVRLVPRSANAPAHTKIFRPNPISSNTSKNNQTTWVVCKAIHSSTQHALCWTQISNENMCDSSSEKKEPKVEESDEFQTRTSIDFRIGSHDLRWYDPLPLVTLLPLSQLDLSTSELAISR